MPECTLPTPIRDRTSKCELKLRNGIKFERANLGRKTVYTGFPPLQIQNATLQNAPIFR